MSLATSQCCAYYRGLFSASLLAVGRSTSPSQKAPSIFQTKNKPAVPRRSGFTSFGRAGDIVVENHHINIVYALGFTKLERELGIEAVAGMMGDADEHTATAVGRARMPSTMRSGPGAVKISPAILTSKSPSPIQPTIAGSCPLPLADDQCDLAAALWALCAYDETVVIESDDVTISGAETLKHFVDDILRLH